MTFHVPVESMGFSIKNPCIRQRAVQPVGNLLKLFGGEPMSMVLVMSG